MVGYQARPGRRGMIESGGEVVPQSDARSGRYTISRHDAPDGLHWDLFLEAGDTLATWRLSAPPEHGVVECRPLPDHRLVYLDYDGPVSGDRGVVARYSSGRYRLEGNLLCLEGGVSAGLYRWEDGRTRLRPAPCQGAS